MTNLEKNMNALRAQMKYPEMVDWILKEDKPADWVELVKNEKGIYNLLVLKDNHIHSVYNPDNPKANARKTAKKLGLFRDTATAIVGVGCGHLLKEILVKKEKLHKVMVVEPVPQLVKWTLEIYDLTKWIDNRTLFFAPTVEAFNFLIGAMEGVHVILDWVMVSEGIAMLRPEEYADSIKGVIEIINQIRCNVGTVSGSGWEIAQNDILNLPYLIRHRGVAELTDIYKNKPAILVSTGPSLAKNMHLLMDKEVQDKFVIIAVAQALRPLLSYDIKPDFICTVDFGKVNVSHFKGLMDTDVPLVCLNRTYAPILKQWQGGKFVVATPVPGYENTTVGVISEKGYLESGGSVSHMNLGLAYLLGCNPICIIGQDFSFADKRHTSLADTTGDIRIDENGFIQWKVTDPRSHLYGKEYSEGPAHFVPGYWGGMVLTNFGLASFITSFDRMVKNYKDRRIVNCTEGGCKLKGTEQMTLKKAIKEFSGDDIDKSKVREMSKNNIVDNAEDLIREAIPKIKSDIKLLSNLQKNTWRALKPARKIIKYLDGEEILNEKELLNCLGDNEKYSVIAQELAKQNNLVSVSIYHASRALYSKRFTDVKKTVNHLLKNEDDLRIHTDKNVMILTVARKAATRLKKAYKTTLELLQLYIETGNLELLEDKKPEPIELDDAEKYFEADNFARPLIDANRWVKKYKGKLFEKSNDSIMNIINIGRQMRQEAIDKAEEYQNEKDWDKLIEYNELIEESQKVGREEKDWDKAEELLRKAVELVPDEFMGRWGLGTVLHHLQEYDESREIFLKLIEDFPDNKRLKFEYGNLLLMIDADEGIKQIIEVMKDTEEFDGFFASLARLYWMKNRKDFAIDAYKQYLKKFPADYMIWMELRGKLVELGRMKEANDCQKKINKIRGKTF